MTTKPTYEELAQGVLDLEEAWQDLFGQICSNPVKNAWGQPVDFTNINNAREKTSGLVYRLKYHSAEAVKKFVEECQDYRKSSDPVLLMPSEPPRPTLQQYLQDSDDQGYNMKDMLLQSFVDEERRRMSKTGEDESGRNLYSEVEQKINDLDISLVDVLQAVFHVFERAAKGDTKSE